MKQNLHLTKTSIKKNKKYRNISLILDKYYKKYYRKIYFNYFIYVYGEYLFDSYKNYKVRNKTSKLLVKKHFDKKTVFAEYEFQSPIDPELLNTLRLKNQYSDDFHHFLYVSIKIGENHFDEYQYLYTMNMPDILLEFHLKYKIYFFFFQEMSLHYSDTFSTNFRFLICVDGKYKKEEIVELKTNLNNLFVFSEVLVRPLYNSLNFFNPKMFYFLYNLNNADVYVDNINNVCVDFCFFEYHKKLLDFYKLALHTTFTDGYRNLGFFTEHMKQAIIKKFYHGVKKDYEKEASTLYFDKMEPRFDKDLISNLRYSYVYLPRDLKNTKI